MNIPQFSPQQNLDAGERITYFGLTDSRNKKIPFGIKQEDRSRHTYVIGKTGMGKSTMLENMAVQDIQNGEGMCFIDPHGGTAERLMEYIPEHRVKDVLYFAPFDLQYPISFNVLENVDADKRHLVVAGLMSAFEKIWIDAWSARMAYILQNTIGALLEFPGATLLSVNRMYIDKEYRKNVVAKVTDPSVRSFWVDEFTKYTDRYAQEATPAIQNKIGQFASNALVRNVIGQESSSFNIREIMDERKIFIVNLSKGRVGEGNANLLGSMLITKIYLAAMSRADVSAGNRGALPPFYLFVDEFQNFANKSFAEILSEARKYKLALTIAHQYIEQMEEEVRAAVFGNVGSMMAFRVGAYDAEVLEKEFAPTFEVDDLVNLGARQIYLKLMIDSVSSQPFSATTMPPIDTPEVDSTEKAIAFSRATYSRPREEVEKAIEDWTEKKYTDPEAPAKEKARLERRAAREATGEQPPRVATTARPASTAPRNTAYKGRASASAATGTPVYQQKPQATSTPRQVQQRPAPAHTPAPKIEMKTPAQVVQEQKVSEQSQKKEEPLPDSLKDVLSRVSTQNSTSKVEQKKDATAQQGARKSAQVTASPAKKLAPERDDGKGVTDEGKAELRNLLGSLAKKTVPKQEKKTVILKPKQAPKKEQLTGKQKTFDSATTVPPAVRNSQGTQQSAPKQDLQEVDPETLKKMLHVDKPNLK